MNNPGWLQTIILIVLALQVPNILILTYSLATFRKRSEKLYAALGEPQDASHLGLTPPRGPCSPSSQPCTGWASHGWERRCLAWDFSMCCWCWRCTA